MYNSRWLESSCNNSAATILHSATVREDDYCVRNYQPYDDTPATNATGRTAFEYVPEF